MEMNRQKRRIVERNFKKCCCSYCNHYESIHEKSKKQIATNANYFSRLANQNLYRLIKYTEVLDIELMYLKK